MWKRIIYLIPVLFLILASPVNGVIYTSWGATLYPAQGSTTGEVLILIRVVPDRAPYPLYLYVFYDGICLIQRQVAPLSAGVYTYQWDVKVKPPATALATAYGDHIITIRIEEPDGTASTKALVYKIVDGVPQGEWWKNLPPAYSVYVKGLKGDTGAIGPQGPVGETGVLGPQGERGPQGEQGPQGVKGDAGARGQAGLDFDPALSYSALVAAIGAIVVSAYVFTVTRRANP